FLPCGSWRVVESSTACLLPQGVSTLAVSSLFIGDLYHVLPTWLTASDWLSECFVSTFSVDYCGETESEGEGPEHRQRFVSQAEDPTSVLRTGLAPTCFTVLCPRGFLAVRIIIYS
ncbi:hypothetical protein BaRGS_00040065, partial [Batillaria attramentaria]